MILKLNKRDLEKLKKLIEIKYINISVSKMFEEFNSYYNLIEKSKIQNHKTTVLNEFLNYFEIDSEDKENKKIIEEYLKPAIKLVNNQTLFSNTYFKNIDFKQVKFKHYTLEFDTYYAYQTFPYDDVKFLDNFQEIYQIGYFEKDVKYPAITKDHIIWMSVTPNEILTMQSSINMTKGDVLTFGLGLGYYAYMASLKEDVKSITIVENDQTIIDLFCQYLLPQFDKKEKIKIIKADAFNFLNQTNIIDFDYIFVDIYHGANDGLPLYLKFKKYEEKSKPFVYWLENSILGLYRRLVLTVFEETLEGYLEKNYLRAKTNEDSIINDIYFKLKEVKFTTFEEIHSLLSLDGLKKLIKQDYEN